MKTMKLSTWILQITLQTPFFWIKIRGMKKIFRLAALLAVFSVAAVAASAQESNDGACKITFDANGGDGSMNEQAFPIGMSQRLSANKFTFKGAQFLGWATEKGANTVDYANSESITINKSMTLYAVWDFKLISAGAHSFYICDHEVTQKEYERFCEYGGERFPSRFGMDDSYPAYFVSWYDAIVYCNARSRAEGLTPVYSIKDSTDPNDWGDIPKETSKRWNSVVADPDADGYRLPTEAEWVRAAGVTPKDPVTEDEVETKVVAQTSESVENDESGEPKSAVASSDGTAGEQPASTETSTTAKKKKKSILGNYAWYRDNSKFKTHIVKGKQCNENGLYDMIGNVREWCWDRCGSDHPHAKKDGVAVSTGEVNGSSRLTRGGCWNNTLETCAVEEKGYLTPAARNFFVGFRVVRSAPGM